MTDHKHDRYPVTAYGFTEQQADLLVELWESGDRLDPIIGDMSDAERLKKLRSGFTRRQTAFLREMLTTGNLLEPLLGPLAGSYRRIGYSLETALDGVRHDLDADDLNIFYEHGLNAHHIHLLNRSERGWRLYNEYPEYEVIAPYFMSKAPVDYLVHLLITEKSWADIHKMRDRYERARKGNPDLDENGQPDTTAALEAAVVMLVGLMTTPNPGCCPEGPVTTS